MDNVQNSRTNNLNFGEYVIGRDQIKLRHREDELLGLQKYKSELFQLFF